MSDHAARKRAQNGNLKTVLGLGLACAALFFWLDYRDIRHDEISPRRCAELNWLWNETLRPRFEFRGVLNVETFDCPSQVSGLVRGLAVFYETEFYLNGEAPALELQQWLMRLAPAFGNSPSARFAGSTNYAANQINLNPAILLRGDAVEVAGIIVHEARHLEEGRNTHVPCVSDMRLTCDPRLEENLLQGGPYNYNILLYHMIDRHSDADGQKRRSAKRLLETTLNSRFNSVAAPLRSKYLE